MIQVPEHIKNLTDELVTIGDLNLRIKKGDTVSLFSYNKEITVQRVMRSFNGGDLKIALESSPPKIKIVAGPKRVKVRELQLSKKFIQSRVTCIARRTQAQEKNFIDGLEEDFLQPAFNQTENENAKTAEKIMHSEILDGFDDPLKRDE